VAKGGKINALPKSKNSLVRTLDRDPRKQKREETFKTICDFK